MKRFFLHPTGSVCYDETGITYPTKETIDFISLVRSCGATNPRWCRYWGFYNLPKVLTFSLDPSKAKALQQTIDERCGYAFIVKEKDWR